nr:MBOAT family protein [Nitrosomonas sp.]
MLFNSSAFLAFYFVFFPTYWAIHRNIPARNALILVGSYFFYGSWDWRFLSLIFISTVIDFYCAKRIYNSQNNKTRKYFFTLSLVTNLGTLAVFKYFGFFVSSFIDLMSALGIHANFTTLNIILPVGISFYTFQSLSYTIDIYRRNLKPTDSFLNFAAFVAFFPQLVAGPIERAKSLLPQIENPTIFRFNQFRDGLYLILWGLVKKTLIADRLAVYVDIVYADPSSHTAAQCLIATLFFTIQIYCDFSGYSDIARGIAKTLGIETMVNFKTPYFSFSIREFWQRWHISLSTCFRDYVYFPLGGSKVDDLTFKRNILITFLLSGLWHGAAYTFIIWGLIHALGYFFDPHSRIHDKKLFNSTMLYKISGLTWTAGFVILAWVFFRANSLDDAIVVLSNIMSIIPGLGHLSSGASSSSIIVGMNNTEFLLSLYFLTMLFITDY